MNASADLADGDLQVVVNFSPAVPTGKVFVAEFANAKVQIPTAQLSRFTVFSGGRQVYLAPDLVGMDFTINHYNLSQKVSFFSNPGEQLRLNMTRFPSDVGTADVTFTLWGYLIDEEEPE